MNWSCRSCHIKGTYRSRNAGWCGGAYFGWILGATPTNGRTCCNCVKRVTGTDTGYGAWACNNCKRRRGALAEGNFADAGFETGMSRVPLNTSSGQSWLHDDGKEQAGQEWLRRQTRLDLSHVQFKSLLDMLPRFSVNCTTLVSIDVSHNLLLESLPLAALCALPALQELSCADCPLLISPPPEVALQGGRAVMAFVRDVVSSGVRNQSMVLFLIGDGESGKTSLRNALVSSENHTVPIGQDNRTVGISISRWDLLQSHDVDFTIYDMAGQSLYRDTHTFFVGRRAVYIFVWRIRPDGKLSTSLEDEVDVMVSSWVQTLQFRIPGSSVIAIATHAEGVPEESVRAQCSLVRRILLKHTSPGLGDGDALRVWKGGESVVVDSISSKGIVEAREAVLSFAKSLPWFGELLPLRWVSLMRQLALPSRPFIPWDEYAALGALHGLSDETLRSATVFLHETSRIRYFGYQQIDAAAASVSVEDKRGSNLSRLFRRFSRKKDVEGKGIRETNAGLFDASLIEDTMRETVYISPTWICDVMKGLIRHDRTCLFRHFQSRGDYEMVHKVRRLVCNAVLHEDLVEFLWPACRGSACREFWDAASSSEEREHWGDITVASREDIKAALGVLVSFDLAAFKGRDLVVPMLLRKSTAIRTSEALHSIPCPFLTQFSYRALPCGFFERVMTRVMRWAYHVDMSGTAIVCFHRGNIGQINIVKRGQDVLLTIKASSQIIWRKVYADLLTVVAFFPGLQRQHAGQHDSSPFEAMQSFPDPVQVLLLSDDLKPAATVRDRLLAQDPELNIAVLPKPSPLALSDGAGSGKAFSAQATRTAVLLMDKKFARRKHLVEKAAALHTAGCILIPVLMTGYVVENYDVWWPSNMSWLESHRLFVDCRTTLRMKVEKEIFPQVTKALDEWRGPCGVYASVGQDGAKPQKENIACPDCFYSGAQPVYGFSREECVASLKRQHARGHREHASSSSCLSLSSSFTSSTRSGKPETAEVEVALSSYQLTCPRGHKHDAVSLLEKAVLLEAIPCPACLLNRHPAPHLFARDSLLCIFDDENVQKKGIVNCPVCASSGRPDALRILDVLQPDIFISYNWGPEKETQLLVTPLVRHIELQTSVVCWFDIRGGINAGSNFVLDMQRGVARCTVFVAFLSDAYCTSKNCLRELEGAFELGKFVVPVLVPGWSGCGPEAGKDWWRHAAAVYSTASLDVLLCNAKWHTLREFRPVDMRDTPADEVCQVIGEEIVCRIMSRFHRPIHLRSDGLSPDDIDVSAQTTGESEASFDHV